MGNSPEARSRLKRLRPYIAVAAVAALGAGAAVATNVGAARARRRRHSPATRPPTTVSKTLYLGHNPATPIKHLVVLFDENVSFDHYFGTYPYAANTGRHHVHRQEGHADGERAVHLDHRHPGRPARC